MLCLDSAGMLASVYTELGAGWSLGRREEL